MREKLIKFIAADNPAIDISTLKDDVSLFEQGLDSLGRISLFFKIEEEYGITVADTDIDNLKSLNDILAFTKRKIS